MALVHERLERLERVRGVHVLADPIAMRLSFLPPIALSSTLHGMGRLLIAPAAVWQGGKNWKILGEFPRAVAGETGALSIALGVSADGTVSVGQAYISQLTPSRSAGTWRMAW